MKTNAASSDSPTSPKNSGNYIPSVFHRDSMSAEELSMHIEGCVCNDRRSQEKIYRSFYPYTKAICERYSKNREDSIEIINDGFLKVFKGIHRYKPEFNDVVTSFKAWIRKIMVYTAIDHFRKTHKDWSVVDIDNGTVPIPSAGEDALSRMSYEEIMKSIQELTPGYRLVINLFIIEGFSHEEIADRLGISIGTSKSNLAKGRKQLQKILSQQNYIR